MLGDSSPSAVASTIDSQYRDEESMMESTLDHGRCRYPYCIVWTPLPVITWVFPFIGHMGICTSTGVIRDFAGSYTVTEDNMAFGKPTKYWQLSPHNAYNGRAGWDAAVFKASEIYKKKVHIICLDNCHSHVAMALNLMNYKGSQRWNMGWLALYMIIFSRYVSFKGFLKTWMPFILIVTIIWTLVYSGYLLWTKLWNKR